MSEKSPEKEAVDGPSHYGGKENIYEAIKVIRAWKLGFSLGNTIKYISRAGKKDPSKTIEDLKKAAWYLNEEIETLEGTKAQPDHKLYMNYIPTKDIDLADFTFKTIYNSVVGERSHWIYKRLHEYTLPRGTGATSFMISLYKKLKDQGNVVIFAVPKRSYVAPYISNGIIDEKDTYFGDMEGLMTKAVQLRSKKVDYIICDNFTYANTNHNFKLVDLLPFVNKKILSINTDD